MLHQFSRNELVIGTEGLEILKSKRVGILGVGGVGSFAAESLARSGVGSLVLMDKDDIDITNVNRQIHATTKTVGCSKVEEMKKRILDINPECEVIAIQDFYTEDTYPVFYKKPLDFVIDACDTVTFKIHLIKYCLANNIPVISVMGSANKLDPTKFQIATESPTIANKEYLEKIGKQDSSIRKAKIPPASNAFCPSVAGLIAANYVYTNLLKNIKILTVEKPI